MSDKCLDDETVFQGALKVLEQELCPEEHLLNPDSDYLKRVAQGLFYKVYILNHTIYLQMNVPLFLNLLSVCISNNW